MAPMTRARRFVDLAGEIASLIDSDTDAVGPELLPVRLCKAGARALGVPGASLSLFTDPQMRVPIGASDDAATFAERLQFTLGEGPCFQAQTSGQMVFATEHELSDSWPEYHRALLAHTPYRAVLSVPLDQGLQGMGALDLYFEDAEAMGALDIDDVDAVARTVTSLLTDMPHDRGEGNPPKWLDNPAVERRAQVWIAMGMLNTRFQLNSSDALALLRAYSFAGNRTVDDTAGDLSHRRLSVEELATA
jgi:hypothetical protein